MNKRIFKGLILMGLVFVIFITITVKLVLLIITKVQKGDIEAMNDLVKNKIPGGDLSWIWIFVILFLILWLYSIIDALIDGLKIEKEIKEESL